jgi:hypothetical protein
MKKTLIAFLLLTTTFEGCQKKKDTPAPTTSKTYSFQMYQDVKTLTKVCAMYDAGTLDLTTNGPLDSCTFLFKYTKGNTVLWGVNQQASAYMLTDTLSLTDTLFAPSEANYFHSTSDWSKFTWNFKVPTATDSSDYIYGHFGQSSYVDGPDPSAPYPAANQLSVVFKKVPDKYYPMYKNLLPTAWKNLTDSLYAHPTIK